MLHCFPAQAVISCVNLSKFRAETGDEAGHTETAASNVAGDSAAGIRAAQAGQGSASGNVAIAAEACSTLMAGAGSTLTEPRDCSTASLPSHQVSHPQAAAVAAGQVTLTPPAASALRPLLGPSEPAYASVSALTPLLDPSESLLGHVLSPALHSEVMMRNFHLLIRFCQTTNTCRKRMHCGAQPATGGPGESVADQPSTSPSMHGTCGTFESHVPLTLSTVGSARPDLSRSRNRRVRRAGRVPHHGRGCTAAVPRAEAPPAGG